MNEVSNIAIDLDYLDQEKTEKANRVCQLVLNSIRESLPGLTEKSGSDIMPFLADIEKLIPADKHEELQDTLKTVVVLGLLQDLAGTELATYLEKLSEHLPDDAPEISPNDILPPQAVVN